MIECDCTTIDLQSTECVRHHDEQYIEYNTFQYNKMSMYQFFEISISRCFMILLIEIDLHEDASSESDALRCSDLLFFFVCNCNKRKKQVNKFCFQTFTLF